MGFTNRPARCCLAVYWRTGTRGKIAGLSALWILAACLLAPPHTRADRRVPTYDPNSPSLMVTLSRCEACHQNDSTFSHPVNFTPSRPLPEAFPLENGRFTCMTCHEEGPVDSTSESSLDRHEAPVRGGVHGSAHCAQCHGTSDRKNGVGHGVAMGQAHLAWRNEEEITALSTRTPGLDALSQQCLSCHDGSSAGRGLGRSHPVGVPYESWRFDTRRSPSRRLNPTTSLDRRIRLFAGNLGCGSCHSPFSQEDKLLVMPNQHDQLCISCHQMR